MKLSTVIALGVGIVAYVNYPEQTVEAAKGTYKLLVAFIGMGLTKLIAWSIAA